MHNLNSNPSSSLQIHMVTWNLGSAIPTDLSQLLGDERPLIVVSIQEVGSRLTSMTSAERSSRNVPTAAIHRTKTLATKSCNYKNHSSRKGIITSLAQLRYRGNQKKMEETVASSLPDGYRILCSQWMWQTGLILIINDSTMTGRISDLHTGHKPTGVAGVCGDKGAVWAKLLIDGAIRLCFVNSHLAAHEGDKYRKERNAQVARITRAIEAQDGNKLMAQMYDHVFWCGDLNYRLNAKSFPDASTDSDSDSHSDQGKADAPSKKKPSLKERKKLDVKRRSQYVKSIFCLRAAQPNTVIKDRVDQLGRMDELSAEMRPGGAFDGYCEGDITFAPTFKVCRHAHYPESNASLDEQGWLRGKEYQVQRTPAYCDRILWCSMLHRQTQVHQLAYGSLNQYSSSDHKPVYATFQLDPLTLAPCPYHQQFNVSPWLRELANERVLWAERSAAGLYNGVVLT